MPIKPMGNPTGEGQPTAKKPAAKRNVRSKEELIADAEIPADGTALKMKTPDGVVDVPWPEAAQRFIAAGGKRGGETDFVDTADRYKAWKWQRGVQELDAAGAAGALNEDESPTTPAPSAGGQGPSAFQGPAAPEDERKKARLSEANGSVYDYVREMTHEGQDLVICTVRDGDGKEYSLPTQQWDEMLCYLDPAAQDLVRSAAVADLPAEAQPGDEVRIGTDTYRVGHGGVLTASPIADEQTGVTLKPYRRWQRELGSGSGGQWQSDIVGLPYPDQVAAQSNGAPGSEVDRVEESVVASLEAQVEEAAKSNGGTVVQNFAAADVEQVGLNTWKVGSGVLEKIGLPEYSALQIGPYTASRQVLVTSGDRYQYTRENGSVISAPREVIDAMVECGHACEIAIRIGRADALAFIAAAKPGSVDMAKGGGANMS